MQIPRFNSKHAYYVTHIIHMIVITQRNIAIKWRIVLGTNHGYELSIELKDLCTEV